MPSFIEELDAISPRDQKDSSRARKAYIDALAKEAESDAAEAEELVNIAVDAAEKRFTDALKSTEKTNASVVAKLDGAIESGVAKVAAAVKEGNVKRAEALVEKLAGVLGDARGTQSAAITKLEAATQEMKKELVASRKELLAAVEKAVAGIKVEPALVAPRKPWKGRISITDRDENGFAKNFVATPS